MVCSKSRTWSVTKCVNIYPSRTSSSFLSRITQYFQSNWLLLEVVCWSSLETGANVAFVDPFNYFCETRQDTAVQPLDLRLKECLYTKALSFFSFFFWIKMWKISESNLNAMKTYKWVMRISVYGRLFKLLESLNICGETLYFWFCKMKAAKNILYLSYTSWEQLSFCSFFSNWEQTPLPFIK